MLQISLLFFSETGNTEKVAGFIRDGIHKVDNSIAVKLMNYKNEENVDVDFINGRIFSFQYK